MTKRAGLLVLALAGALLLPWGALSIASWYVSVPDLNTLAADQNLRVFDRGGQLILESRGKEGTRHQGIRYAEIPRELELALLAAEDARFHSHPGVDPLAMLRALGQAISERRVVSGASTLTQQLARTTFERQRSLSDKLHELALALAIERRLSKSQILEAYFNRVPFGPNVQGVAAASRYYFDKPVSGLDLVEAATLAAVPRGPTLYDPRRGTEPVKRRRDWILTRLHEQGSLDEAAWKAALLRPVRLQTMYREGGADHLVRALVRGNRC